MFVLAAVLAVSTAQPFATFGSGDEGPPFLRQPATVGPTNAPTTTPAPVTQGTAAPSIAAAAPAPSIQPQNNTSQTSAGNTSSLSASGFIRPFGTYFVDSQCRNFVPVCWCLAALEFAQSRISGEALPFAECFYVRRVRWAGTGTRRPSVQCVCCLVVLRICDVEAIRRDIEWGWRWPHR